MVDLRQTLPFDADPLVTFHGPLGPEDVPRLTKHLERFIEYVSDGKEHRLDVTARDLGMMQTSASARWRQIKDFGYDYEKRKEAPGLYMYKVVKWPSAGQSTASRS